MLTVAQPTHNRANDEQEGALVYRDQCLKLPPHYIMPDGRLDMSKWKLLGRWKLSEA